MRPVFLFKGVIYINCKRQAHRLPFSLRCGFCACAIKDCFSRYACAPLETALIDSCKRQARRLPFSLRCGFCACAIKDCFSRYACAPLETALIDSCKRQARRLPFSLRCVLLSFVSKIIYRVLENYFLNIMVWQN